MRTETGEKTLRFRRPAPPAAPPAASLMTSRCARRSEHVGLEELKRILVAEDTAGAEGAANGNGRETEDMEDEDGDSHDDDDELIEEWKDVLFAMYDAYTHSAGVRGKMMAEYDRSSVVRKAFMFAYVADMESDGEQWYLRHYMSQYDKMVDDGEKRRAFEYLVERVTRWSQSKRVTLASAFL